MDGSDFIGITKEDLFADYTGIRPKLQPPNGVFHDFHIKNEKGFVNLMGIESPGLTSSLAIGEYVEALLY
jgi:L-2-hydroxyglutarate oxidase LhgO